MHSYFKILRHISIVVFILNTTMLCALNISAQEAETDGGRTITFCGKIKVENFEIKQTPAGPVVLPPLELGGYRNINIVSQDLAGALGACFNGDCATVKACDIGFKVASSRLVNEGKTLIVNTVFDRQLGVVFLVSKHLRKGKAAYRVKTPQDFKFIDKTYAAKIKSEILKYARQNL